MRSIMQPQAKSRQMQHPILPKTNLEEVSRQDFVRDFRLFLGGVLGPANKTVWEKSLGPAFVKDHGREPENADEVRAVMTKDHRYQIWSAMQRNSQERMWDSVIDAVERQLPDLIEKAKTTKSNVDGTLTLDPDLKIPNYMTDHDIHLQPGNYQADLTEDDVAAGAIYDRGIYIYSMGYMGGRLDTLGRSNVEMFKKLFPGLKPTRILDMGCAIGNGTLPWAEAFPDAEIHAIDIGPALLRYGHARAEGLGMKINFSQQNAERTNFEEGSFDVVTSHIMMHETYFDAVSNIFGESRRLLKPGGVMLHLDLPRFVDMKPVKAFLASWEAYNNGEDFAGDYRKMDIIDEAVKGGWQEDEVWIEQCDVIDEIASGYLVSNYVEPFLQWPTMAGVKGGRPEPTR